MLLTQTRVYFPHALTPTCGYSADLLDTGEAREKYRDKRATTASTWATTAAKNRLACPVARRRVVKYGVDTIALKSSAAAGGFRQELFTTLPAGRSFRAQFAVVFNNCTECSVKLIQVLSSWMTNIPRWKSRQYRYYQGTIRFNTTRQQWQTMEGPRLRSWHCGQRLATASHPTSAARSQPALPVASRR